MKGSSNHNNPCLSQIKSVCSTISWTGLTPVSQLCIVGTVTGYHGNVRKWYHSGQTSVEILEWLLEAFQNNSVYWIYGWLNWLQLTHLLLLLNIWLLLLRKRVLNVLPWQEKNTNHLTSLIQAAEDTKQRKSKIYLFLSIWAEFNPNFTFRRSNLRLRLHFSDCFETCS